MYSLFSKIFFTYWLIILTIEVFTAWFTANLSQLEIHPILEKQNRQFVSDSMQAVDIIETQGLASLRAWLLKDDNRKAVEEIYVINQRQEEVNRKEIPTNISELAKGSRGGSPSAADSQRIVNVLTFDTKTPDGNYLLISTFKYPSMASYLFAPQRVAVGVIVSGLICFLLARYFTSPLTKLRSAAQLLMQGEFNTAGIQQLRNRRDEFGALAVDFENMAVRLEELLSAKRQLLRDISHELRSPLARIRVGLDLARKKYGESDCEDLDRIDLEIERLDLLISELLVFARIRSNKTLGSMSPVYLSDLLQQIVDDAAYELQQTPESAKVLLDVSQEVVVKADARLLHRAIENVVRNALRYSLKGGCVRISSMTDAGTARILIEDEGPGVPNDMLEKIFQPFVRVSSARETETGGTGIGLAIARRVVELHQGSIVACNRPGNKGFSVMVSLPLDGHKT